MQAMALFLFNEEKLRLRDVRGPVRRFLQLTHTRTNWELINPTVSTALGIVHSTADKSGWAAVSSSALNGMPADKAIDGVISACCVISDNMFHTQKDVANEWIEVNIGVPWTVRCTIYSLTIDFKK